MKRNYFLAGFLLVILIILLIVLLKGSSPYSVEKALSAAGANKNELQKVLDHYKKDEADSLKLKAARFLIEHMPAHYTYSGAVADTFYTIMGSIFENPRDQGRKFYTEKYDSILSIWGNRMEQMDKHWDAEYMTADYLIRNIEEAFEMWQTSWSTHYSFDVFCEYILPYRAGKEPLSNWRPLYINRKPSELDLLKQVSNKTFVYGMTNSLNEKFVTNLYYPSTRIPEYPLTMLLDLKAGSCADYSNQGVAQMRALGIPVAIDFVPQWGRRSMGHEWNALVVSDEVSIPFGTNDALGRHLYGYFEEVFPKVYRKTYSQQKESLFYLANGEAIPELFNTPCIKDVTTHYLHDIKDLKVAFFDLPKYPRFAYLSVFDNHNWNIVQWGKRKGNKAIFKTMGTGCIYLPVHYKGSGKIAPLSWPVLCSMQGDRILKPDTTRKEKIRLTRKFRYSRNLERCAQRVKGGKFQVANKEDFSDSITLHVITETPECAFQKVTFDYEGSYKYFRYLAPAESYCNMAEIELYDTKGDTLAIDRIFSIDGGNPGYEDYRCFDGDVLTYYNANWCPHYGWIATEFKQPIHLSYLYYLPRNDDNFIREGELYELYYWGKEGWKSLGRKKGIKDAFLVYDNAPANALFLLHNHTRGKEERIFTYENGKQVWW